MVQHIIASIFSDASSKMDSANIFRPRRCACSRKSSSDAKGTALCPRSKASRSKRNAVSRSPCCREPLSKALKQEVSLAEQTNRYVSYIYINYVYICIYIIYNEITWHIINIWCSENSRHSEIHIYIYMILGFKWWFSGFFWISWDFMGRNSSTTSHGDFGGEDKHRSLMMDWTKPCLMTPEEKHRKTIGKWWFNGI